MDLIVDVSMIINGKTIRICRCYGVIFLPTKEAMILHTVISVHLTTLLNENVMPIHL